MFQMKGRQIEQLFFFRYVQIIRFNSLPFYWFLWFAWFWIIFGLFILYTTTVFTHGLVFIKKQVSWTLLSFLCISIFFQLSKKQFLLIGLIGTLSNLTAINYTLLKNFSINGARRWVEVGPVLYQPVEIQKPFFVIIFGYISNAPQLQIKNFFPRDQYSLVQGKNYTFESFFSVFTNFFSKLLPLKKKPIQTQILLVSGQKRSKKSSKISPEITNFFSILFTIGVLFGIFLQPDFASGLLYLMILFFLLFIKKLSYHYLVLLSSFVFLFLLLNILQHPYQLNRILFFLFSSTLTDTFTGNIPVPSQLTQSLETILRGGIWGVGLGCSNTNANTFPIYYADFIFSVFFENFGLFGSIFFFLFLNFFSSFYIFNCLKLKKSLDITICLGCFLFLSFQTCIHLAVTCNLLPITGIPLPFISYGGNAQFACLSLLSLSIRLFYENIRPIQRQNNFTFNTKKHLLIDTK